MTRQRTDELDMVPYTYSFCRRCDARVELGRVAFGATVTCPACGLEFAITRQQQSRDGAGQGSWDRTETPRDCGRGDCEQNEFRSADTAWDAADGGSLAKLFFCGTFSFPLRLATLWQTLTLCAGTIALVGAFRLGAWCASADGEDVDRSTRLLLANGLLFSLSFGSLALLAWSFMASAYGMTILRETACGVDAVKEWPNMLALEELGEIVHVAGSLLLAAAPGAIAIPLWDRLEVPAPWGIGGGIMVLFPILLLSTLDANSAAHPLSLSVWKSLLRRWPAWLGFYATTYAAGIAVVGLEIALRRHSNWAVEVVVSGVVLATAWMVYFRLLGRLASVFAFHPTEGLETRR